MRYPFLAILVIVPIALIGWMYWVGHLPPPPEPLPAARKIAGRRRAARAVPAAACRGQARGRDCPLRPQGPVQLHRRRRPHLHRAPFRKLAAAELASADGAEFTCDVYDMTTPAGAESIPQGALGHGHPRRRLPQGVSGPMSLVFRQGRYYVKLTAFDAKAEAALPGVGQAIAGKIQ